MNAAHESRSREYPARPFVGVGVVVWREDRVLLVRRARPPRAGSWSLPGGLLELGETAQDAARREVAEETGIAVRLLGLIDVVDLVRRDEAGRVRRHYTLLDYAAEWARGELRAGSDAAEAAWFPLAGLEDLDLWSETVRIIRRSRERRGGDDLGGGP